ncbi:kinase-like protein [Cantharellus anzutake]|uniref:kinase-like protein n=1 Tax=Cantharellus anzutake TaxID=1750568 RepID=UPI00190753E3|nr:kinase-like protein [Cantharellus anzutake]KAF8329088.1 kinase-like protein [Cantharellus anzutake]
MSPTKIGGGYGEIRASIPIGALNEYLSQHTHVIKAPVTVKQFQYGQSNPTYFLTDVLGIRFVLRKKPSGTLLSPTAHAIEREFRVLSALQLYNEHTKDDTRKIPIPNPIILCEDQAVIGTSFYVMEFLEGRIFADFKMPQLSPSERKACWLDAVRVLALLGSLNPGDLGLETFGPHTAYFPRQIKSLARISRLQAEAVDVDTKQTVGPIPYFEESIQWYSTHLPHESKVGTRIVHGDYKIDNLVFHPTETRVIGILDWELCTLGSPLADLGNLTLPYNFGPSIATTGYLSEGLRGAPQEAIPITLGEIEREYCQVAKMSYPIKEMPFVRSWMTFRLAIISQGIAARHARRQASSLSAQDQGKLFHKLGLIARDIYIEARDGSQL